MSSLFLHYGLIFTYGCRAFSYSITNSNMKSSNTFSPNRRTRFLQIAEHVFSKSPNILLQISKIFHRSVNNIRSILFSSEKTQSSISPYTCHGLRALHYGWSAVVPWSLLFLLHIHGLHARRYGLWASQGREFSIELIARTPLILPISSYFDNCHTAHVLFFSLWRRPSL